MNVEEFINSYSAEYLFIFHNKKKEKKIAFSKRVSNFLFEPRYEVNGLKFKKI